MKIKNTLKIILILSVASVAAAETKSENTKDSSQGYLLSYIEREPGVDEYEVTMLISDRFIRIDEAGDQSGYIIYDDKDKIIYSVSNVDKSVLVITSHVFSEKDLPVKATIEYLQLDDAPTVSGKEIYNYRVYPAKDKEETSCTEIQLVENILPKVRKILRNYQLVVSGQQVKTTDNKLSELQTACYFIDEIYNTGAYYEKGLPIQEWHNNERSKILTSYKKVALEKGKFMVPEKYKRFSVDKDSKILLN